MCLGLLLLSFMFNFSYLCSMDIFKSEQDKLFPIIANNQQIIHVPYEYAVQLKSLHPLQERAVFNSQHNHADITLLLQSFKAAQQNNRDVFLKKIVGEASPINIECEIDHLSSSCISEQKANAFFKHLAEHNALKKMGKMPTLMSVAHDLQATDFVMLCVSHIIDKPSQNKLFSVLTNSKRRLKFERLLERDIVAQSKKIRIHEDELDIQDHLRSAWISRACVSPCDNKIIKIINNQIKVYNAQGQLLLQLAEGKFKGTVVSADFNRDGKSIVGIRYNSSALHEKSAFCVWDATTGKLLIELPFIHEIIFADLNDDATLAGIIVKCMDSNHRDDWHIVLIDLKNYAMPRIINQISWYKVQSLYFRENNSIVFYEDVSPASMQYVWDINRGKQMIAELDFAQKMFLYQLYKCVKIKQSSVSLMIGFVKDSVKKSLPKVLQDWAFSRAYNIRSEYQGDDSCSLI